MSEDSVDGGLSEAVAALKAKREAAAPAATAASQDQPAPGEQAPASPAAPQPAPKPAEGETPAAPEQGEAEPSEALERHTVTMKGDDGAEITEEVTLDELKSGYMRRADHTRKTQEMAKERGALPHQVEQGVAQIRGQYARDLENIRSLVVQTVAPELTNVDWAKLAQENPQEWMRLNTRAAQVHNLMNGITRKAEEAKQQSEHTQKKANDKQASECVSTLQREIPGFNLDHYQKLLQGAASHYGFNEMGDVRDARQFMILNDALKYRDIMAKKPAAQAKLENAPKMVKAGASTPKTDIHQARVESARKQLQESGETEDAVSLLRAKRARQGA